MPKIVLSTEINAPIERVFDLARCVDLHTETMNKYREKAVGGVTSGLIGPDEIVTWEAVHFGLRQKLTVQITKFDRPHHFQDSMISGIFQSLVHDHYFSENAGGTVMEDVFCYQSPLAFLGNVADALFLRKYMTRLLTERNELIKQIAESDGWKKYLT